MTIEEPKTKASIFLSRCKGVALVLTAVSALVLGIISQVREDPKMKAGYLETAKQIEALSKDTHYLAETVRWQQDQIATIQSWILNTSSRRSTFDPESAKILLQRVRFRAPPKPPIRKAEPWTAVRP